MTSPRGCCHPGSHVGEGDHAKKYTNGELLQIFMPDNPDLPFVYHNLRWDHCPAADH